MLKGLTLNPLCPVHFSHWEWGELPTVAPLSQIAPARPRPDGWAPLPLSPPLPGVTSPPAAFLSVPYLLTGGRGQADS